MKRTRRFAASWPTRYRQVSKGGARRPTPSLWFWSRWPREFARRRGHVQVPVEAHSGRDRFSQDSLGRMRLGNGSASGGPHDGSIPISSLQSGVGACVDGTAFELGEPANNLSDGAAGGRGDVDGRLGSGPPISRVVPVGCDPGEAGARTQGCALLNSNASGPTSTLADWLLSGTVTGLDPEERP
jgi:hypothetical protein